MIFKGSKLYFLLLFAINSAALSKSAPQKDGRKVEDFSEISLTKEQIEKLTKETATLVDILERIEEPTLTPVLFVIEKVTVENVSQSSDEKVNNEDEESSENKDSSEKVEESDEKVEKNISSKVEITSDLAILTTTEKIKEKEALEPFTVWNDEGKICLLAKFDADFAITYAGRRGDEKAHVAMKNANPKGKCASKSQLPLLQLSWARYVFTMMFNKTKEDTWIVSSMELNYDTSAPLFDGAVYAGKKTARSKPLSLFETPLNKSYYCAAEEVVFMYTGNKQVATLRIKNIHLQPFEVEDGKFSPFLRCDKVVIDEAVYIQDETVPLAIGCTLAIIVLIILVGFSIRRAIQAAKAEYNSMG